MKNCVIENAILFVYLLLLTFVLLFVHGVLDNY